MTDKPSAPREIWTAASYLEQNPGTSLHQKIYLAIEEFSGPATVTGPREHWVAKENYDKLSRALAVAKEALKMSEGYIFHLSQPDRGDLFSEWDEKYKKALEQFDEVMKANGK